MPSSHKIVLIREEKSPSDARVVLTPQQCRQLRSEGWNISVQKSDVRAFSNEEYTAQGIPLVEEIHDFDVFIGVKEVPISNLIPKKTYFFFSHTIKEQAYNRRLLQTAINRHLRLIDYEVITDDNGQRLIAFGKFAGMVGAHNGLWTNGKRTGLFDLPHMYQSVDYDAVKKIYSTVQFPPLKIALTGTGRVANGAALVLEDMGIRKVRPIDFVSQEYDQPVFTQLNSFYYAARKDGRVFDDVQDFYNNPQDYISDFHHFARKADIFINGIYWDNRAPAFFSAEEMADPAFRIKVIADVTCDIAPVSSIPSTLRASTIAEPVFGYDPLTGSEVPSFSEGCIDMMTIDNLPNELPRDASFAFGQMFVRHVLPELQNTESTLLDRATICRDGALTKYFSYLNDYISQDA